MINNPVLRKEMLMRLRLRQIPTATKVGISVAIAVLMGVIYYFVIVKGILTEPNSETSYGIWAAIVGIQFGLICLIAPVVTANAITQEKEQQTWEMLIFTRLLPGEIIFGKLIARLASLVVVLILFAPIELFAWICASHQPGSSSYVSFSMVFLTYITMIVTGVFYATFGLYMSWLVKRTIYAIMLSYSFVIGGLIIITFLITAMMTYISEDIFNKCPLMWINPVMMIYHAIDPVDPTNTNATLFLIYGLIVYVMVTLLLLWRMTVGFRRFAYDN